MATTDDGSRTLRVVPKDLKRSVAGPGESPALGRPGAGRASVPLLAYVLHSHDWSETSLIVELFTRSQGRVVVAAKGAKRPTSAQRAMLLPFQPITVQLGKPPKDDSTEVLNLRSAEWTGGAPLLKAAAMLPGFYVNELLLKLLARQDPHPVLFDVYADTLAALASGVDEAATLRAFELLLLRELGWLPDLAVVTQTAQPVQAGARYTLLAENGLVPTAQNGATGAVWQALHAAVLHGSAAAVRAACHGATPALRAPLRALLQYHLGNIQLRTRHVGLDLQKLLEPGRVNPLPPNSPYVNATAAA